MGMQEDIVAAMRRAVAEVGMELRDSWRQANVGDLHVTRRGALDAVFTVEVTFHHGHMSAAIIYPGEWAANSIPRRGRNEFRARGFPSAQYRGSTDIQGVIDAVRAEAARHAPEAGHGPSLDEAYVEAVEACGPQEVADAMAGFLKAQPREVRDVVIKMLTSLKRPPAPRM